MGLDSQSISTRYVVRSTAEPGGKFPGLMWIDESGGNVELNQWNGSAWECWLARGPDIPEYPVEGSLWRDTGKGELNQYDGNSFGPVSSPTLAYETQPAETWSESDLSLTHSQTYTANQKLSLGNTDTTTASWSDTASNSANSEAGLIINPNTDLQGIKVSQHTDVSGTINNLVIENDSDGTTLYSDSVSLGDTTTVDGVTLSQGTRYRIYLTGSDIGAQGNDATPFTSTDVDIVDGWLNGGVDSYAWIFDNVTARVTASNGTAYVTWATPTDFPSWGNISYTEEPNGETIEVYIEEDTGTWEEIAGPVNPGAEITASQSNDVRFRVDFSQSGGGVPKIPSMYRTTSLLP